MLGLKIIYSLNILIAGWVGITSLFFPKTALISVFSSAYAENEIIRLVGALWLGIAILSALGLWKPITFSPVLILQLIYKGVWLVIVALPAAINNVNYPKALAIFFFVWVIILPFIIPWKELFGNNL